MTTKEFKLEVLRMTLETGSARVQADPLQTADKFLNWCLHEDKPEKTVMEFPAPGKRSKAKKG